VVQCSRPSRYSTPPSPFPGNYRLSGTELRRCGQSGVMGRYCTHFHMMGNRPDAYITDLSVHRSYQRVVSVHASNDVVVANNVGFDIRAHAFFVEDGQYARPPPSYLPRHPLLSQRSSCSSCSGFTVAVVIMGVLSGVEKRSLFEGNLAIQVR
jgi:hypothetical protein